MGELRFDEKTVRVKPLMQEPPVPPLLAFVKTPVWKWPMPGAMQPLPGWCRIWATGVEEYRLPAAFKHAWKWHQTIMEADIAKNYARGMNRAGPAE